MASSIPAPAPAELAVAAMQMARPRGRRMPWLMRLGLGFVALLAVLAVVAPWVIPQDPERQSLRARLKPPTWEGADGRAHILGTDHLGRDIAANCANCHGTDGRSRGATPSLAGQDAAVFVQRMKEFRGGRRAATVMQQLAKGYTEAQIEAAAAYFAAQAKQ